VKKELSVSTSQRMWGSLGGPGHPKVVLGWGQQQKAEDPDTFFHSWISLV